MKGGLWTSFSRARPPVVRRRAQLIFQNPFDALNPRFTIWRSLTEPLVDGGIPRGEYPDYVERALDLARFAQGRASCSDIAPV